MSEPRFNLAIDSLGEEEIEAAVSVLRSGRYTMGAAVRAFEAEIARWVGADHAIMVNSGSSANLLLIDSLLRRVPPAVPALKPGDEVLVPALAWPTTVWPMVQLGLVPVYVDIDPRTLALALGPAERAISPRTRALFLIHVLGQACPMQPYVEFCRRHGLVLMEDCCETFGAFDGGRHVGTFGYGGTFSHYYSHHITTLEGGTIVTSDAALADDLRSARSHGWARGRSDEKEIARRYPQFDVRFLFLMPGYNCRPLDLQAAIGLVQLRQADELLAARDELARRLVGWIRRYTPWLRPIGAARCAPSPLTDRKARRNSWMTLPLEVTDDAPPVMSVERVKAAFESRGVETRPIIAGNLARHPGASYGVERIGGPTPVADRMLARGLMIGCHPVASEAGIAQVEKALKDLASGRGS